MGRALKIKKSTNIDIGYPAFSTLEAPVKDSDNVLNDAEFLGVVGGTDVTATPSATYPVVSVTVNIASSSTGEDSGYIIRQKGAHKFLVGTNTKIDPENAVVGVALQIAAVGDTDWNAMGFVGTPAVGSIFTPTAAAGSGTSGTASEVGVCVLTNDANPAAGYCSVQFSVSADSTAVFASYISNKWIRDWNGMTYGDYSDSNTGTEVYSSQNFYPVNFFSDEGTVTWSGAEVIGGASAANGTLQLAQVNKTTS